MLNNIEDRTLQNQNESILEQYFSQLPAEGKVRFRDYLQNIVGMQNSMDMLSKDEVKGRCPDKKDIYGSGGNLL